MVQCKPSEFDREESGQRESPKVQEGIMGKLMFFRGQT